MKRSRYRYAKKAFIDDVGLSGSISSVAPLPGLLELAECVDQDLAQALQSGPLERSRLGHSRPRLGRQCPRLIPGSQCAVHAPQAGACQGALVNEPLKLRVAPVHDGRIAARHMPQHQRCSRSTRKRLV